MSHSVNSLRLLCENYQSDSDDENKDADSSSKSQEHLTVEISKLPLPESIRNLYVTAAEVIDDAESHSGRVRSFPHERGNWVTSVFITYDNPKQLHWICDTLIKDSGETIGFHRCDNFHISLSRTVILRHHWIDLFVEDLKERLKNVKSFYVDVGELAVFVNEENTRSFVGPKITQGFNQLLKCIKLVDESLLEFKLPIFYEDPAFHVSLVWCLGNRKKEVENILPILQTHLDKLNTAETTLMLVNQISCKVGNRLYNFALSPGF